ncbi:MAG: polya polymerase [Clostridiales bacterium]|nr:polya polymerase [Clostridiales bacterium]MBP3941903.1 polya polymerase [Christensenellaceae bacterium]MBR2223769.1 polya polymerase [Christensenellaceae bacterium]MBR3843242.1 polya polymerase [Christensenellaceae bacterium]
MKIKNITEPQKFFEVLNECKGRVELVTSEGDRLNMKSTLCQYIALTQMFKDATIDEVELVVSEPEDMYKLLKFLVKGD